MLFLAAAQALPLSKYLQNLMMVVKNKGKH